MAPPRLCPVTQRGMVREEDGSSLWTDGNTSLDCVGKTTVHTARIWGPRHEGRFYIGQKIGDSLCAAKSQENGLFQNRHEAMKLTMSKKRDVVALPEFLSPVAEVLLIGEIAVTGHVIACPNTETGASKSLSMTSSITSSPKRYYR